MHRPGSRRAHDPLSHSEGWTAQGVQHPDSVGPFPTVPRDEKGKATHPHDCKFPFQPSRCWQNLFQSVGIKGVSFHCLRLTKITLIRREGVPRKVAIRLVNHSSELIQFLYDRHQVQALVAFSDAGTAGLWAAMPRSRSTTPARSGRKIPSPS